MDLDSEITSYGPEAEGAEDAPARPLRVPGFDGFRVPEATRPRASGDADDSRSEAGDALDGYIRSLRGPRVLDREETYELARRYEAEREAFLLEVTGVPGTAQLLVERWRARQGRGHVTAALSARYRDGSGVDPGPGIDRALGAVERLLEKRQALPTGRAQSDLDAEIGRAIRRAGLAFEVILEVYRELRALAEAPRRRGVLEARRRRGLTLPEHRARLARARRTLERLDAVKQTFVVHNLRLVIKQAKRFRSMGVPYLDLIQEGNLGLIRAVEKFDYSLGYKFSTYAIWWIDQALVRAVQNASRTVRVPTHLYDLQIRLGRTRERLRVELGRSPTRDELAETLDVRPEEVERVTSAMQPITSTQASLPGTDEFKLEDVLAEEDPHDPVESIERMDLAARLGAKVECLGEREREIIEARFGLGGNEPLTLREIGERMGLSRERVRQIEARALAQLREAAREEGLQASLDGFGP